MRKSQFYDNCESLRLGNSIENQLAQQNILFSLDSTVQNVFHLKFGAFGLKNIFQTILYLLNFNPNAY